MPLNRDAWVSYSDSSTLLISRPLLSSPTTPVSPAARSGSASGNFWKGAPHERLIIGHRHGLRLDPFPKWMRTVRSSKSQNLGQHVQEITPAQLTQMRDEFWDTSSSYGGQKEIWDALRAAAEADLPLAQTIVDSAGLIVFNSDMTLCYDERGAKYELPKKAAGQRKRQKDGSTQEETEEKLSFLTLSSIQDAMQEKRGRRFAAGPVDPSLGGLVVQRSPPIPTGVDLPEHARPGALKTLLDQLAENPSPSLLVARVAGSSVGRADAPRPLPARCSRLHRGRRRGRLCELQFSGGRLGTSTSSAPARATTSAGRRCTSRKMSQDTRNVCGIPWNWSRIHHRGKSFLDMAGRSFSCGLSDPKSASAARRSEAAAISAGSRGYMNGSRSHPHFPVTARLTSSSSSDSDSLPLLVDGVRNGIGGISRRSFSGELRIFSNQD
ncbi:hypothetical protein GUJ93_ZPchr0286g2793 [Zizania palustris]|uniref:DC-UbP/UBTD2 N-terminal domain-containing protein n=1 Tax=Zizania palustris TaxID=103762 RepID=A0A8J5TAN7_ZIZPA|nr:hypothetical protein GUJ93_ZPchr0286g2793 [Zizania palustris]